MSGLTGAPQFPAKIAAGRQAWGKAQCSRLVWHLPSSVRRPSRAISRGGRGTPVDADTCVAPARTHASADLEDTAISICIVGVGFRGLGVLERIVAHALKGAVARSIRVHLVDPSSHGPDQYDRSQPDYLLLNIVCGQVSVFPDAASVGDCAPISGPTLYEWVRARGLLLGSDGFSIREVGRPIEADDFLPRRLLGEYLGWFRGLLKERAGRTIEIIQHSACGTDLSADGSRFTVELSDGTSVDADYVFLTVGQCPEPAVTGGYSVPPCIAEASTRHVTHPYPLPQQLMAVEPEQTIAIAGLGLSAIDAVLALTIGRGGEFEMCEGILRYIPSGQEPAIILFSRSGLPYRSRPSLGAPTAYDPVVFTRANIDAIRTERGPVLDYDRDVLPLLFAELRVAYARAQKGRDHGWDAAQQLLNELRDPHRLESLLAQVEVNGSMFDPRFAYFGTPLPDDRRDILHDTASYEDWYQRWLEDDLQQARLGVGRSPLKAALEICREFRDIIRYAVDFGGLTNGSADRFFSIHAETINRIVVGPQKERAADVLALMRAGILSVPLGPTPTVEWDQSKARWILGSSSFRVRHEANADWLYSASTSRLQSLANEPTIIGAMARRGFLRRTRPDSSVIHAVDVDREYHPISHAGVVNSQIWVLGLLCEGVTFYNGYVTSPGKFVRSQYDADHAVAAILRGRSDDNRLTPRKTPR